MDDFFIRLFTIIIGSIFALMLLLYNEITLTIFFTGICIICLCEFQISIDDVVGKTYSFLTSMSVYGLIVGYAFDLLNAQYIILTLPIIYSLFAFEILAKERFSFRHVGLGIISIVWIAVPLSLCVLMTLCQSSVSGGFEPRLMIGIMIITWFNDAGAYCIGRMGGSTPLHPQLSPKKTWEGTIGGGLTAVISGYFVRRYFTLLDINWGYIIVICIMCGSIGDLIESMFKRSLSIKDTGKLLPGHGGLLDRFDAILYNTPFIFTYLVLNGAFFTEQINT